MDCIISGVSLYTQSLLLVLAHCIPEDEDEDEDNKPSTPTRFTPGPTGGIRRRQNNLRPELRLIDLSSETETTMESLTMSRFETLGSGDYHLGVLPAHDIASSVVASRGALETLAGFGTDMLYAAINPMSLFSSGASIRSKDSNDGASSSRVASTPKNPSTAHKSGVGTGAASAGTGSVHPNLLKPGIKIFIHSPYDCILATKRDLSDHYLWLLERDQYQQAWELIDQHPEIVSSAEKLPEFTPGTPERTQGLDDFYEETASVKDGVRDFYSSPEKEKRRVGELWVQELVEAGQWARAGRVCGKVLGSPERWEKWVWAFAGANRFDEIVDYIPSEPMHPPIPRTIYEVVLGHYIQTDKPRFRELLDRWALELFDLATVSTALENQIKYGEAREDSVEGGEIGRDWRIVMDSLARLHEANGRQREALKCYIKLQDPDSAMRLIKQSHLAEAVTDDIPGFITLRVPQGQAEHMSIPELEQATLEAVTLLVDEAQHGLVRPAVVVYQLQEKELNLYIYFYLRALWRGEGIEEHGGQFRDRLVSDSRTLVDDFADLAVHLFAVYDRPLLMDFLKISTAYAFEKVCPFLFVFLSHVPLLFASFPPVLIPTSRLGNSRVRVPQLRPRAGVFVLQNRTNETCLVSHHRPSGRRLTSNRIRQRAKRPGPVGRSPKLQHGQTTIHSRPTRGGRHSHQPHYPRAPHTRRARDPRVARGPQTHYEGARDPVQHQLGRGQGPSKRSCRGSESTAQRPEERCQVRGRRAGAGRSGRPG